MRIDQGEWEGKGTTDEYFSPAFDDWFLLAVKRNDRLLTLGVFGEAPDDEGLSPRARKEVQPLGIAGLRFRDFPANTWTTVRKPLDGLTQGDVEMEVRFSEDALHLAL